MRIYENCIDGQARSGKKHFVTSPWSGRTVAEVEFGSEKDMRDAIVAASAARAALRATKRAARAEFLNAIARMIEERGDLLARMLVEEAGKPIDLAEVEISRSLTTFRAASVEARVFSGTKIPIDAWPTSFEFFDADYLWEPRGVVLGVTPFNFPLNLVAHKIAPAIAAGCPIIIKPASKAPGPAHLLCTEIARLAETKEFHGFKNAVQCLSIENDLVALAIENNDIAVLSFTGSDTVGWALKSKAGKKQVCLELGGNAAVVIDESARIDLAVDRCVTGAFAYAGQSCISVQRIYVINSIFDVFIEKMLAATSKVSTGDPAKRGTVVGPVIDAEAAKRILGWVDESVAGGARLLCGGTSNVNQPLLIAPTLVTGTKTSDALVCNEVFGPVAVVESVKSLEEAIAAVNRSRFGLQAAIFSNSLASTQRFAEEVRAGGVLLNEIPSFRVDHMPYGGIKDSGFGREGLRFAMEEFSERKLVVARKY